MCQRGDTGLRIQLVVSVVVVAVNRRIGTQEKGCASTDHDVAASDASRVLRGLFEDGSVHLRGDSLDHVEWSNISGELVDSVRVMLLRLGIIVGTLRSNKQPTLFIHGQNAKKFGAIVGLISAFKQDRFAAPAGNETRYPVPLNRKEQEQLPQAGLRASVKSNARHNGYISRHYAQLAAATHTAIGSILERSA